MHQTLSASLPFRYRVNPDGRSDGYTKVLTANVDNVTIPLPAAAVALAKKLTVDFKIVTNAAILTVFAWPNASSPAATSDVISTYSTGAGPTLATARSTASPLQLGYSGTAANVLVSGKFELEVPTGLRRVLFSQLTAWDGTTPRTDLQSFNTAHWDDSATVLSSILISGSIVGGLRIGSRFTATLEG